METILVVDVGTSSLRATVAAIDGTVHAVASRGYSPTFLDGTQVEQAPESWERALVESIAEVLQAAGQSGNGIVAVSVTSQRASVIPVGADGRPLSPALMWQDKRSVAQSDALVRLFGAAGLYGRTGLRSDPYFSAPKIMWIAEHENEMFERTARFIGVQDWIVYLLTREYLTDASQACRTLLMDIRTHEWDTELLAAAGVPAEKLPTIVRPGTAPAAITADFARATGLAAGTPVVLSGGDQQNAALALGVLHQGTAEANTGTGSFLLAYANRPVLDPELRTLCSAGAIGDTWVVEAGLLTSGMVYAWAQEQFYREAAGAGLDTMNREAEASPPGANGVVVLPHFKGAASPYWNPHVKGLFSGVTMSTTRGDLARAILEGIALELSRNLAVMDGLLGRIAEVSVAGGLSRLGLFNAIQADCFGRPVKRYGNSEASTLGALMNAGVCVGVFPDHEAAFAAVCREPPEVIEANGELAEFYRLLRDRLGRMYRVVATQSE